MYSVKYNIADNAANVATEVVRLIEVVDTTGPIVTLQIAKPFVEAAYGLEYVDAGATAKDLISGDVSDLISVENLVDTSRIGAYEVHYTAVDAAGNVGELVKRVVVVKDLVPLLSSWSWSSEGDCS